jgi:hypothetical protein
MEGDQEALAGVTHKHKPLLTHMMNAFMHSMNVRCGGVRYVMGLMWMNDGLMNGI